MRISLHSVIKHAIYTLALIAAVIIQCAFLDKVRILGARPQIVLLYVLAISFFETARVGAIYGAVGGYILDIACGGGAFFSAVIYMLICYLASYAVELYLSDGYLPFLASSAVFMISKHILDTFVLISNYSGLNFGKTVLTIFLPETLYTLVLSAAIYYPVMLMCTRLNRDVY